MIVVKKHVRKDNESCNFCSRGELNSLGFGLVYPYEYVYMILRDNKNGLAATICEDCLKELNEKVSKQ